MRLMTISLLTVVSPVHILGIAQPDLTPRMLGSDSLQGAAVSHGLSFTKKTSDTDVSSLA